MLFWSLVVILVVALTANPAAGHEQDARACPAAPGWSELVIPRNLPNGGGTALRALSIAADFADSSRLYLGTSRGLFTSDDCGGSWTAIVREGLSRGDEMYIDTVQADSAGFIYSGLRHP